MTLLAPTLRLGVLTAALSLVAGCDNPTDPTGVARVTFNVARTEIFIGESVPIALAVTNSRGEAIAGSRVEWYSSDSTVAYPAIHHGNDTNFERLSRSMIHAPRLGSVRFGAVVDGLRGELQLKVVPAPVPAAPTALQGGYYPRGGWVGLWWQAVVPYAAHEYRIEKKKDGAWTLYHTRRTESGSSWNDQYPGPYGTTQEYRVLLCNGTGCSAPSDAVSVAIPIP